MTLLIVKHLLKLIFRREHSSTERESGLRRLGCTNIYHHSGSSQGDRYRGGVSDNGL